MLLRVGHLSDTFIDRLLGHWVWVVPVLLVVAALSLRQSDLHPPAEDEFYSMSNAGWLLGGPYSPYEILDSLARNSPNHTPLYFLVLSLWGQLTTTDILLARMLSLLIALLSAAMVYRLARDLLAPVAGNLAIIIFSSLAFLNYYIAFARMYTMLALMSAIVLWLYLRITHQLVAVRRSDYLALGAAIFGLLSTFVFGAVLLVTIGVYHLIVAHKDRRWLMTSGAALIALLLFTPWLSVVVTDGLQRATGYVDWESLNGLEAMRAWLEMSLNNEFLLLALTIGGIAIGMMRKQASFQPWMLLFIPYSLTLAVIAQFTHYISLDTMRYHVPGLIPFVLFAAAGIYGLYCLRRWLGLSVLLWVMAGVTFQGTARWYDWLGGRVFTYSREPVHAIARLAGREQTPPAILGYQFDNFWLDYPGAMDYSQGEHYFESRDIAIRTPADIEAFEDAARRFAVVEPWIWLAYRPNRVDAAEAAVLIELMGELNYQHCEIAEIKPQTLVIKYSWSTLGCAPPQLLGSYESDLIDYEFYGAALNSDSSNVAFSDRWIARQEIPRKTYGTSVQLVNDDWDKVAQVDLPLTHEGKVRRFTVDVSDVSAGHYRLVTILYDRQSGERFHWLNNPGYVHDMLLLAEIEIED